MTQIAPHPQKIRTEQPEVVGSFHRFGEMGVTYEVVAFQGDDTVTIQVLESGEKLEYPLSNVLLDPAA